MEKKEESEFKEEIINSDKPILLKRGPKKLKSKLIGKKTLLGKVSSQLTEPKPINKKSNAEFLVESIVKNYWTSKWKEQLVIMKYSRVGFNKKRANFRLLCSYLNRSMKYHHYLYLVKLFDKMDKLPQKTDVKHDTFYEKIKLVRKNKGENDNKEKNNNENIIILDNCTIKIEIPQLTEVEFKPQEEEQIKENEAPPKLKILKNKKKLLNPNKEININTTKNDNNNIITNDININSINSDKNNNNKENNIIGSDNNINKTDNNNKNDNNIKGNINITNDNNINTKENNYINTKENNNININKDNDNKDKKDLNKTEIKEVPIAQMKVEEKETNKPHFLTLLRNIIDENISKIKGNNSHNNNETKNKNDENNKNMNIDLNNNKNELLNSHKNDLKPIIEKDILKQGETQNGPSEPSIQLKEGMVENKIKNENGVSITPPKEMNINLEIKPSIKEPQKENLKEELKVQVQEIKIPETTINKECETESEKKGQILSKKIKRNEETFLEINNKDEESHKKGKSVNLIRNKNSGLEIEEDEEIKLKKKERKMSDFNS